MSIFNLFVVVSSSSSYHSKQSSAGSSSQKVHNTAWTQRDDTKRAGWTGDGPHMSTCVSHSCAVSLHLSLSLRLVVVHVHE
jgi:hypothetical protein